MSEDPKGSATKPSTATNDRLAADRARLEEGVAMNQAAWAATRAEAAARAEAATSAEPSADEYCAASAYAAAPADVQGTEDTVSTHDARISLRLSSEARAAVDKIMQLGNMDTMQEAVRRAIGDELFLMTERRDGWKVLLKKGNRYREVSWPKF